MCPSCGLMPFAFFRAASTPWWARSTSWQKTRRGASFWWGSRTPVTAPVPGRVALHQTWATFRQPTTAQARSLPTRRERTTRSRSLFFLAAGLAAAAGIGPDVPLHVPENGLIGINVPLVPARSGSLSTRTTHPHFIDLLRSIATAIGVHNPIVNSLRLQTKGEALATCARPDLLATIARISVSCAHPTAARWEGGSGSCGYCYPCLIRRASLYVVGLDRAGDYRVDVLTKADVLRTGPVREVAAYADLHRRGLAELETWMRTATDPDVRAHLRW
jgi:hypothetical protein